jgi:hypothetical protein
VARGRKTGQRGYRVLVEDQHETATYTRRQFLEYRSIMSGEPWWVARDSVAGAAAENPGWNLDERFTWAEWQRQEGVPGGPPGLTTVS